MGSKEMRESKYEKCRYSQITRALSTNSKWWSLWWAISNQWFTMINIWDIYIIKIPQHPSGRFILIPGGLRNVCTEPCSGSVIIMGIVVEMFTVHIGLLVIIKLISIPFPLVIAHFCPHPGNKYPKWAGESRLICSRGRQRVFQRVAPKSLWTEERGVSKHPAV